MFSVYVAQNSSIASTDDITQGIEEIEEWNEYDELHEALGVDTAFTAYPPKPTSLFEPAPSKTPPPLAGALPGGFAFGQTGDSSFASLGALGGSKAKENTPIASAEQNLAIRQMGAEAAKIAASKKPAPVKISTTNPLLTEKINAKSPADVLSPKSTPLPKSPDTATSEKKEGEVTKTELPDILSPRSIPLPQTPGAVPKLGPQKPVQAPPSMHDDAEDPTALAGPVKETQAEKESSEEEGSSEEESSEDTTPEKEAEKTQAQDPKDTSKAGTSVKEGEQEEESSEEESEQESEEELNAGPANKKEEVKPTETKVVTPAALPKQSSSEETSEDEGEESEEDVKQDEVKKDEVKKTQTQDAKDASKAGESVLD